MATTNEILTRLVADTKQFNGAMNGTIKIMERFNKKGEVVGQSVQVMTKHMKDGANKTAGFGSAMTALSRDIKVTGTIFNTLKSSIVGAYEAASEGAKILAAEEFFKNSGKSIESYRQATNGMLSDAELMKKANLADSMGINEETFKKLTVVAEASALKTGQSFDHMFNSIIVGTARSSRLLLDNLGIIVSVGQANEKYAASIGKTVEELSAQEKQIAFVNEVALKSQGTLDEFANVADKNAISFSRFDAVLQNLVDVIKVNLAQALGEVLPSFTTFFQNVLDLAREKDWGSIGAYIAYSLGAGLNTTLATLAPDPASMAMFKGFAKSSEAAAEGVLVSAQNQKSNNVTAQEDRLLSLLKTARPNMGGMQMADREVKLQFFADFSKKQIEALKEVDPHWAGLIEAIQETAKNLKLLPKPTPPPGADGGAGDKKVGAPKEKAFGDTKFASLMKVMDDSINDFAARDRAKSASSLMAPLFSSGFLTNLDAGEKGMDRQAKRIEEINGLLSEEAKLRRETINQAAADATTSIMTGQGLIAPLADAMTAATGGIGKTIGDALGPALEGAGMGAAGGPMGAAIGAIVAVLMQLLDQLKPIMDIIGAIMSGLELFIKHGLGEFLESLSSLAGPIQNLLAALGLLLGSALRPFTWILTGAVAIVAAVIDAFAFVITVISPFVEAIIWVVESLFLFFVPLIPLFEDMGRAVGAVMGFLNSLSNAIIDTAIAINNAIVGFIKGLGIKGFGKILSRSDFEKDPVDENTDAVNANTQAVKDLTREFRNLPSGYKAEGAIYSSSAPERNRMREGLGLTPTIGLNNARWRT